MTEREPVTKDGRQLQLTWMIRRHIDEVLEIEQSRRSVGYEPWDESEVLACMRGRANIGVVAEQRHRVLGFALYGMDRTDIHVFRIAVHPDQERNHVGTEILRRLQSKLSQQKRRTITCDVSEYNLAGQLFLQSVGFACVRIRNDCGTSYYSMKYRLTDDKKPQEAVNRISGLFVD